MENLKQIYEKYKHGVPLILYLTVYLLWFAWLEKTVTKHYDVIYMGIDDYIPFCELFIIPYLLWFGYIAVTVLYFFFRNKDDYYKTCIFLFTGMTVFLIISTLFPNGHHLRLAEMPRDNIFTRLVTGLWQTDTPTNLWPSIHVYNSLGIHFAISNSQNFEKKKGIRIASFVLAWSIVLSTMFLKQHSVFDVLTAFVMAAVMYLIVYKYDILMIYRAIRSKRKAKPQIS